MALPWLKGAICLLHKDGKILFVDYRDYPHKIHQGKYSPPGGTFEEIKDKSSIDTAVRETMEEVNIIARDLIYRGTVHFNNESRTVNGKPMKINMTVDIFDCSDFDDSEAQALENKDGKVPKLEWISDSQIPTIKEMHEGDRKMFEWLRMYKEFEGTISQVGETLGEGVIQSSTN